MDPATVAAVLEDHESAAIDARLCAALGFLKKLTRSPGDVDHRDVVPLRAAGLDEVAIAEALYVCFLFNVMDRLADALAFHDGDAAYHARCSALLHYLGYGIVRMVNALGRRADAGRASAVTEA